MTHKNCKYTTVMSQAEDNNTMEDSENDKNSSPMSSPPHSPKDITSGSKSRSCVILLTLIGVPLFMVWWQLGAMDTAENSALLGQQTAGESNHLRNHPKKDDTNNFNLDINTDDLAAMDTSALEHKNGKKKNDKDEPFDVLSDVVQTTVKNSSNNHKKKNKHKQKNAKDEDPTNDAPKTKNDHPTHPSMVWLMSFPNSGTSYTMRMVQSASQHATATNYGPELIDSSSRSATGDTQPSIPLYPPSKEGEQVEGPFWRASTKDPLYKPLPQDYILTKTHCGGRCVRCTPHRYVLTLPQFIHECTAGMACLPSTNTSKRAHNNDTSTSSSSSSSCEWTETHYPAPPNNPHIGKVIHLIRDPFDNIVSRFHLARKNFRKQLASKNPDMKKDAQDWLDQYSDNATGFATWCQDLDQEYGSPLDHLTTKGKDKKAEQKLVDALSKLHCKAEWFRYVQWHSLTLATMEQSQLPALTVRYEEYEHDWNATVHRILDFVQVPTQNETALASNVLPFVNRPPYDDYYTEEQRTAARILVQEMARPQVWKLMDRYF